MQTTLRRFSKKYACGTSYTGMLCYSRNPAIAVGPFYLTTGTTEWFASPKPDVATKTGLPIAVTAATAVV